MATIDELFAGFRSRLDDYHNQRERVIKASRDITASSKKVIFALQRVKDADDKSQVEEDPQVRKHMDDITGRIESVKGDVTGELNQWKYYRQFTGCLQEWIEAVSFQHFLLHRKVISYEEITARQPDLLITRGDYILGIMDLTGELMRYAIAHLSDNNPPQKRGVSPVAQQIVQTLRQFKSELQGLDIDQVERSLRIKELGKKVSVFESSLAKVEQAIYSLLVRGIELDNLNL